MRSIAFTLACMVVTAPVVAQEKVQSDFVESNIVGTFYHELGHALIDIAQVPIFGQEEDAADVFSIFAIDAIFEEQDAQAVAYDAAVGFMGEVILRDQEGWETPWWDTHGPDEQRFFNTVCLFYGADPENRADFAEELGLPEDRAEYCPEEYDLAASSWGAVMDGLMEGAPGTSIVYEGESGSSASLTEQILAEEVAFLNETFVLPQTLTVRVEDCGEANAFYDPEDRSIVVCTEYEAHLIQMEEKL